MLLSILVNPILSEYVREREVKSVSSLTPIVRVIVNNQDQFIISNYYAGSIL